MTKNKPSKKLISVIKRHYERASSLIYRYRFYVALIYLIISTFYFLIQFPLILNWDMEARILNSNYLFHNGAYFEPMRAPIESLLIGLLSFILGNYAVYGFIALTSLVFFFSLKRFSNAFDIDFLVLFLLLLNPFTLFYGLKNGTELLALSFILLFLSSIKRQDVFAGLFIALAFLSKFYSVFFMPLLLLFFLYQKGRLKALRSVFLSAGIIILSLLPFVLYNSVAYHNIVYPVALSYFNAYNLIAANNVLILQGLMELVIPAAILLFLFSRRKAVLKTIVYRYKDVVVFVLAFLVSMYVYFSASGLMAPLKGLFPGFHLGTFRFALLPLFFAIILVSMFLNRRDYPWIIISSISFLAIAFAMLYFGAVIVAPATAQTQFAVASFASLYNTTGCAVQSNNWVPLDYAGLPATIFPDPAYNDSPIVGYGPINTGEPILFDKYGIFIYGPKTCQKITAPIIMYDFGQMPGELPGNISACGFLFRSFSPAAYVCNLVNSRFGNR